jgi:hypothetical protein
LVIYLRYNHEREKDNEYIQKLISA